MTKILIEVSSDEDERDFTLDFHMAYNQDNPVEAMMDVFREGILETVKELWVSFLDTGPTKQMRDAVAERLVLVFGQGVMEVTSNHRGSGM